MTPDASAPVQEEPKKDQRKKMTSKGHKSRIFSDFLPPEERQFPLNPGEIPEAMRDNPDVSRFFKKVSETLELTPMQLKVIEQYQEVIVLDQLNETAMMVAASRPIPLIQSFVGPSIWAYLTVSRFADHFPYYRL